MDSQSMQQATREAVKKKFGKKRLITGKVVPHYPQSIEREYERVTTAHMKLLSSTVAEYIPRIRDTLTVGRLKQDAADDDPKQEQPDKTVAAAVVLPSIDTIFDEITDDFMKRQGLYGLSAKIEKLSNLNRKLTIAEWKRIVKRTLGINLMDDYYTGEKFQRLFDKWVADNVAMIKMIPQETLGSMRNIIKNSYLSGASNKTIAKQIQEAYDVDKYRAQFYARDQTAKLNVQITQKQHRDAGADEYVWRTDKVQPLSPLVVLRLGTVKRATQPIQQYINGIVFSAYPSEVPLQVDLFTRGNAVQVGDDEYYENTATSDLLDFLNFLDSPSTVEWSNHHDISIDLINGVQDVSEVINDSQWQYRAMVEIQLSFIQWAAEHSSMLNEAAIVFGENGLPTGVKPTKWKPTASGGGTKKTR